LEDYNASEATAGLDVAIIGMSGRFPGAATIDEFWQNLRKGVESISFFSDEELRESGIDEKIFKRPNYVRARGVLTDVDKFDASFFNFFPKEAETLDPQHRIFMECAWEALETAGYAPDNYDGLISLFAGASYIFPFLAATQGKIDTAEGYQVSIGNEKDFLTTKVSYKLNLRGMSVDVQTACSTSLMATYLAYQSLINFQADMALAGGQKSGFTFQEGMILSPDGHCRAFDAAANGTTAGNGCGVVLLKRLEDALADHDNIIAVIKGGAANNDGSLKVGYTAPSIEGQTQVVAEAQYVAGVNPEDISYIETHGTGTNLGDPIEIAALTKAFREQTGRTQFCAIGSVKPNIGHLDAAAGVASLIKTALALKFGEIPPSINYSSPNPKIDFDESPFFVNTELLPWENDAAPRCAGVSSFGIGGTNVHLILQEPPRQELKTNAREHQLVLLSARSQNALSRMRKNLVTHLKDNPDIELADAAYTLQVGRKGFNHRLFAVCNSRKDAITVLENLDPERIRVMSHDQDVEEKSVVFMFSGQGAQYVNMGRDLYDSEATFRDSVDKCCEILQPILNLDLREIIYADENSLDAATEKLQQTRYTQPALFVIEYALAELWRQWGVAPQAMIGHSIGEYVAACQAGVMCLEDALQLVALRGELMSSVPTGTMLSVPLGEERASKYLKDDVSLAALNADDLTVLSGPFAAIEAVEKQLTSDGVEFTRLHTSHAFHSKMMEPILAKFEKAVAKIELSEPEIPYISNVTGTWITATEAVDPNYYAQHIRSAVRFSQGVAEMLENYNYIYLEIGPGKTLCTLTRRNAAASGQMILSSLRHPKEQANDQAFMLNSLGQIWLAGGSIDWNGFNAPQVCRRVPLPTYPFERERFWLDVEVPSITTAANADEKNSDISKWFYAPTWYRSVYAPHFDGAGKDMITLVFHDGEKDALKKRIESDGQQVLFVISGNEYNQVDDITYQIRPDNADDYKRLVNQLEERKMLPRRILHAWQLSAADSSECTSRGLVSMLCLVKALDAAGINHQLSMLVCAYGAFDVSGCEEIVPEQAMLSGACKVIPQEYPNIHCRFIDADQDRLPQVLAEFAAPAADAVVAYRNGHRWLQRFQAFETRTNTPIIKKGGIYVITGGLGNIGLAISRYLADTYKSRLVLVDQVAFPERNEWQRILDENRDDDPMVSKITKLREIEKHSEVLILKADIADETQMADIFDWVEKHVGPMNGLIHAAGLVGARATIPIQNTGAEEVATHLGAKVHGTQVLAKLMQKRKLDFVLLQSSLSSVLGGMGMYAYASANAFLDAMAAQQEDASDTLWLSINWDGWRFAGEEQSAPRSRAEKLTINPDEGISAFELVFKNYYPPQVAISCGDLQARLKKWVEREPGQKMTSAKAGGEKRHARPNLTTPYAAPRTDLEKDIVEMWGDLLGIDEIGIYDDFFDLGGHSLLATQLVSRLRDIYNVELPLRELFESPTVATLSEGIEKTRKKNENENDTIADVLAHVENLSDEEVQKLLKEKGIN